MSLIQTALEDRLKGLEPRQEDSGVAPEVARSTQACFIYDASLDTARAALADGIALTGLALWLGADALQIGLLASLPAFAGLLQILAPLLVDKWGTRRVMYFRTMAASRFIRILPAFLPLILVPAPWRVWGLIVAITIAGALNSVGQVSVLSWLSDMVPLHVRGRFFATRNLIMGVFTLVLTPIVGWFLDLWGGRSGTGSPIGFIVVFVLAGIVGLLGVWAMRRAVEPVTTGTARRAPSLSLLSKPLQDRNMLRYIIARCTWLFGVGLAGPFFQMYQIQVLQMPYVYITVIDSISNLLNLAALRFWGMRVDGWGPKRVLLINASMWALYPSVWLLFSPGNWGLIWVISLFGLGNAGLNLGLTNMLLRLTPREYSTSYISMYTGLIGVANSVSPLIGGLFLRSLIGASWYIGGLQVNTFHVLFILSTVFRLSSLLVLRTVQEKAQWSAPVAQVATARA